MSFKKNKYTVLKQAISPELAEFIYKYFLNKRDVEDFYLIKNIYLHLQHTLAYGMIHKCQILIHTIVTLQWKHY